MVVELPEQLQTALRVMANAQGVSPDGYVYAVLQRDLAPVSAAEPISTPFRTGRGSFAKYGDAPSAEEIDANRADMFRNFCENL